MTDYAAIDAILKELERARQKHPSWPDDPVHQVSIMMEEAGESTRAVNRLAYEGATVDELMTELIQTAAMCIRCLTNLKPEMEVLEPT